MSKQIKPEALRFAALVRVSGESQAKHGESLRTQHNQIENAVVGLDGVVSKWYEGQEHATPGYERVKLEELLRDAGKRKFDAVMVADPSRWSRDNEKSGSALRLLRDNGIRFFDIGREYDLFNETDVLLLQMITSLNQYAAATNIRKAVMNRIARAKRNVPTSGQLPWGRTFNKKTETWGIVEADQKLIEAIALRYIDGEPLRKLAEEYGVEHATLHKRLTKTCGSQWSISFKSARLNIDETVMLTIPALLPPKTVKAIERRIELNTTSSHGSSTTPYLLSRMVFCAKCGGSLSGFRTAQDKPRRYRHFGTNCLRGNIHAGDLEESVVRQLFECFGNPVALQRAMERAVPNNERADGERKRLQHLASELTKIEKGRNRIIELIKKDTITDAQADKHLGELNQREVKLREEFESLTSHLDNAPSPEQIKAIAESVGRKFGTKKSTARRSAVERTIDNDYESMTWAEKRALVEAVFGGKDENGKRLGVYVEPYEGENRYGPKQWTFHIKGHLVDVDGFTLPEEQQPTPTGQSRRGLPGVSKSLRTSRR